MEFLTKLNELKKAQSVNDLKRQILSAESAVRLANNQGLRMHYEAELNNLRAKLKVEITENQKIMAVA